MEDLILKYVQEHEFASFAELEAAIPEFSGPFEAVLEPNVVLWRGISQRAVDALNALLDDGLLVGKPAAPLLYFVDGRLIKLPIANTGWLDKYRRPHWLPLVFATGDQMLQHGRRIPRRPRRVLCSSRRVQPA